MEWLNNIDSTFLLEFFAVASAILYVILASKNKVTCFIFGLISSAIYVYLTIELKFYFDVLINAYYVIMSVIGWYMWQGKLNEKDVYIKAMPSKQLNLALIITALISISLAFIASKLSDAALPYIDAITTCFAVLGTWMLVKKYLQNWLVWIMVDLLAASMYLYKGLYLTAGLFVVYTIIACYGYLNWDKQMQDA